MTCIATVTQGDWQYIREWIEHHLSIGTNLILIAYNGDTKDFDRLPKYKNVRYLDFSCDNEVPACAYHSRKNRWGFAGWHDDYTSVYDMEFQQKTFNIMIDIVRYMYPSVDYLAFIDTDEFVMINNDEFENNINKMFASCFPDINSSFFIPMVFYHDNNIIYNDDNKSCIERFYRRNNRDASWVRSRNLGHKKVVLNLRHEDVKKNLIKMLSPHHCSKVDAKWTLDVKDVELAHFWTKTLEEWISKMSPEIDADYFYRFKGHILYDFFDHGNKMTEEKLKAIPGLLKKYKIDYRPEYEESNREIREKYKQANGL